jgi:hypothetical protein
MQIKSGKILLIVPPHRTDFYNYLGQITDFRFCILFHVHKKNSENIKLPGFISEQYFWSDYNTPLELLKLINPEKLIFFEIIDQRQISLVITANHFDYQTFYLEHGAAGNKETSMLRSESGKISHILFNRIPNIAKRLSISLRDAYRVKKFYFSSFSFLEKTSRKKFLQIPGLMLLYNPNKALMKCLFRERVPKTNILLNKVNFEEFQLYTGINERDALMEGVPFFDSFYKNIEDHSGPVVYLEHPMLEDNVCEWTPEHHKKIALNLKKFAEEFKEKVIIKLHPKSNKRLWDSYDLASEFLSVEQEGDFFEHYLRSKLILGYASSLMNGFLCARKNVVLLGWHPKSHIFGADFSATGLCHVSFTSEDLFSKFSYWLNNNLSCENQISYEDFLTQYNFPFDGKATQRVLSAIAAS